MKKIIKAGLIFLPSIFLVACGAGVVDYPGYDAEYVYSAGDVYPDYWDNMGFDLGYEYVGVGGYYGGGGWHGGGGGWHGGGGHR